jgi:putative oxidoreductase
MLESVERFAAARVQPIEYPKIARGTIAVGRVLLAAIFIASGLNKLFNWGPTVATVAGEGVEPAALFVGIAIALEVIGGVMLIAGLWTRIGALLLMAFLIPTTFIMHDFWTFAGAERQMQMVNFMKNLSILGGLLVVFGVGAGALSVDARLGHGETPRHTGVPYA